MTVRPARDPRGRLLRWGLPRDPAASSHLAGFIVATVATVLLTRGYLAAAGYPQIGGGGLHIAHVLWGGLFMALGFVLLLSFAGPVVRPIGAIVGGVGFGLFVDEIGKFVTSDNDYFYEPTAALIYVVVVGLVLLGEALHGRRALHPLEDLAGAVDHAVAGVAGGFTERARADAHEEVDRAQSVGAVPAADQVRALLDAIDEDHRALPNPIEAVSGAVVRTMRALVTARWVPWITVGVVVATSGAAVVRGVLAWQAGADVPDWILGGLAVSAAASTAVACFGLVVLAGDRPRAYRMFRRAVLISLLVTQVFAFRVEEWGATAGLLVDLLVLGLITAELNQMTTEELRRSEADRVRSERSRGQPA